MKILVIDDTQAHLDSAIQTLSGHDVTVCSSHDEALKLLGEQYDEVELEKRLAQYRSDGTKNPYSRAQEETKLPYWDVVLCDLLMPAGKNAQGDKGRRFIGQEMPIGWSLALKAVKYGAKYVAVVTDTNHHDHPASAMLDSIFDQVININTPEFSRLIVK